MPLRPNFTVVEINGDTVRVEGTSGDDVDDILDIRVVLAQGDRIAGGSVDRLVSVWHANLPVTDPEGKGADFRPDQATAFGVETRRENLTTITWAETVTIR